MNQLQFLIDIDIFQNFFVDVDTDSDIFLIKI